MLRRSRSVFYVFVAPVYFGSSSLSLFRVRTWPIRFKKLSIAVPRGVKRARKCPAPVLLRTDNENIASPAVGSRTQFLAVARIYSAIPPCDRAGI